MQKPASFNLEAVKDKLAALAAKTGKKPQYSDLPVG
jgi:hypothetical protein